MTGGPGVHHASFLILTIAGDAGVPPQIHGTLWGASAMLLAPVTRLSVRLLGSGGMCSLDLRRLDINLLVILDALYDEGTISRVAERLQLSQPTVSAGLGRLRTLLNDDLFVRSQAMMQPTERAMQLRAPIRKVLQTIRTEILEQAGFSPETFSDTITISASDVGELEFMPALYERLRTVAPHASLRTVLRDPHSLAEAMDRGDIDLAIGYLPDLNAAAFMQQVLFNHGSVCLVRRDHPLYGQGITLQQYREARHLVVAQQTRSQDVIDEALALQGIARNVAVTISHFVNVPPLIADSDLVATIARPIAAWHAKFHPVTLIEAPFPISPMQIKQVWHRRFHNSPKLQWLRGLVAEMSQNKPHL
jgi:DNA-binding transcriptional LysR family regulator